MNFSVFNMDIKSELPGLIRVDLKVTSIIALVLVKEVLHSKGTAALGESQ